jgi:site-specific recombinase XerD
MNFRNLLWTYAPRRDGSCDIKLYISHLGKKKYFSTGLKVKPEQWDDSRGVVRKNHPLSTRYNAKINRLRLDIEKHFLDGGKWSNLFKEGKTTNLIDFMRSIIQEGKSGLLPLSKGTLKNYQSSLTRLEQFKSSYGIEAELETMDLAFYNEFTTFLSSHCDCGLPGINKHVKILKRVMNMGLERGLHNNRTHQETGFRRHRVGDSQKIFLTEAEIHELENFDLSDRPFLEKELDRWLVAYHFIMRFSDLVQISKLNLHRIDDRLYFKYRSEKTNKEATIPVKQRALDLLEKHNFDFSWGSNPQANRNIKTAVSLAGLNEVVQEGNRSAPKSAFVTMHTARRSAATNLHLSGQFSVKTIADLGGWDSIKTLQIYLRSSNLDSAKLAGRSEYFL